MSRRWTGEIGQGERDYDQAVYELVVNTAKRRLLGKPSSMPLAKFAELPELAGLQPRTIRAVLSDADGVEFLVVQDLEDRGTSGMYLAEFADEGERFTRNLNARAKSLSVRANRRRQYAEDRLPRKEGLLF